jgi:hypothetical protein
MAPKEKAIELINKYSFLNYKTALSIHEKKQCALIAVDLVINQWEYIDTYLADANGELNPNLKYWYQVKQELLNL